MFVRLTLADVREGEMDNALEYVKNTVMPSYDGISGLLQIAACATNDGRFMAWSTWARVFRRCSSARFYPRVPTRKSPVTGPPAGCGSSSR